jgi:hypothetical protein
MNGIALKIAPTEAADSVAALDSGYALFPATACQTRFWHEQKAPARRR